MVVFDQVSKRYPNGVLALSDASFNITKGEFVFFVGLTGSGKTTIIKLMIKEEDPTDGEIFVNGIELKGMDPYDIPYLRRNIGIVFQDFRLLPHKTAFENVAYAMQITEATPKEIRRQVPSVLSLVGLAKKANAYPDQLSGGEQQRVVLARAIVNNPSLLIADEPTGNLDPDTSLEIMNLLCEINSRGTTVIVVTHEKTIVDTLKKRVIALSNGEIYRDEQKGLYGDEASHCQLSN
ncbi:MAG: cell division ATP-binding protein FtsE [Eubacteriales bacterium]|nr:cell division ATP-binding protein FtsE [Eubacteriales bacterium]